MSATVKLSILEVPYVSSGGNAKGDIVNTVSRIGIVRDTIAAGKTGQLMVAGLATFPKLTSGGSAIPDGTIVYWKSSGPNISATSTDGPFLGLTSGASVDGDATQDVLVHQPGSVNLGANVAALTDNSGGATADGTIAVVTAPTALTDNGGGTADGTVQAQSTFSPTVPWDGATVFPSAADATALTAIALAARNNFKEFTARQTENRAAVVALTDAVKELATKVNAIIANG